MYVACYCPHYVHRDNLSLVTDKNVEKKDPKEIAPLFNSSRNVRKSNSDCYPYERLPQEFINSRALLGGLR